MFCALFLTDILTLAQACLDYFCGEQHESGFVEEFLLVSFPQNRSPSIALENLTKNKQAEHRKESKHFIENLTSKRI